MCSTIDMNRLSNNYEGRTAYIRLKLGWFFGKGWGDTDMRSFRNEKGLFENDNPNTKTPRVLIMNKVKGLVYLAHFHTSSPPTQPHIIHPREPTHLNSIKHSFNITSSCLNKHWHFRSTSVWHLNKRAHTFPLRKAARALPYFPRTRHE